MQKSQSHKALDSFGNTGWHLTLIEHSYPKSPTRPWCTHGNSVLVKSCEEDRSQQDSEGGTVWCELKENRRVWDNKRNPGVQLLKHHWINVRNECIVSRERVWTKGPIDVDGCCFHKDIVSWKKSGKDTGSYANQQNVLSAIHIHKCMLSQLHHR